MDIFKCPLQHFVGDFARPLYGAAHNLLQVPQKRMSDAIPQHWELALLLTNSGWVLLRPTVILRVIVVFANQQ